MLGKAGNLHDQFALLLGERLELLPVGQIQFRDDRLRRERRGIDNPGVGNQLEQPFQKPLAQLAAPEFAQVAVPQQGEQHFFFENRLGRRCEQNAFVDGGGEQLSGDGHVGQVEQFEETIDRVAIGKRERFPVVQQEIVVAGIELPANPVHFRLIRPRLL